MILASLFKEKFDIKNIFGKQLVDDPITKYIKSIFEPFKKGTETEAFTKGIEKASISLVQLGVKSKTASVGMLALKSVLGTLGLLAAGFVLDKAISSIQYLVHESEILAEKAEKALMRIKELNDEFNSKSNTVQKYGERYAELAQHVNQLSGNNIDLSNEEYDEFLQISNELLSVFPQLYKGMNSNGQAFISLQGNVESITSSLQDLIEKEYELKNIEVLKSAPDIFKNVQKQIEDYEGQIDELEEKRQKLVQDRKNVTADNGMPLVVSGNGDINIQKVIKNSDVQMLTNMNNALAQLGIEAETTFKTIKEGTQDVGYVEYIFNIDPEEETKLIASVQKQAEDVRNIFNEESYKLDKEIQGWQTKISQAYADINPVAEAYVKNDFKYFNLSEPMQEMVNTMVASIDYQKLGLDTEEEMKTYINDSILAPLYFATPQVTEAFAQLFDMKTKLQNQEISPEEFSTYVMNMFNGLVSGMDEEMASSFTKAFISGFSKMGIEGGTFDAILANLISSWSVQAEQMGSVSFNFVSDSYKESIKEYQSELTALSEWQNTFLSQGFLSPDALYDLKAQFSDIFDFSEFELTGNFEEMFDGLRQAMIDNLVDPLNELLNDVNIDETVKTSIENAIHLIKGMAEEAFNSIKMINAYNASLDNIQSAYTTVQSAIEEYRNNHSLSLDTIQSLLTLDDKYLASLYDENGQLTLNKEMYNALTQAELDEMSVRIAKDALDLVSSITDETTANDYLKKSTTDLTAVKWEDISTTLTQIETNLAARAEQGEDVSAQREAINQIANSVKARLQLLQNAANSMKYNPTNFYGGGSGGGGKSGSNFKGEIDWLANSFDNISNSIESINNQIDNTSSYEEKLKLLKALETEQKALIKLDEKATTENKKRYDKALGKLSDSDKTKYQKLIESNKAVNIEKFGSKDEKLFNAVSEAQKAWQAYQDSLREYEKQVESVEEIEKRKYEAKQENLDNIIGRYENNRQDTQNKIDLEIAKKGYASKETLQESLDEIQPIIDKEAEKLANAKTKRDKALKVHGKNSPQYKEANEEVQGIQNKITGLKKEQIELNREVMKYPIHKLEEEKKALEEQLKLIQKKKENLTTAIHAASNVVQEQIDYQNELKKNTVKSYDAQIKVIQDKKDALQKTNDSVQRQIDLEKAEFALQKSTNQKNIKIFNGKEFVYEADQDAIKGAQEELDKQLYSNQIANFDEQIDGLNKEKDKALETIDIQIEALEEYKKSIDDIFDAYEKMLGVQQLISLFGDDAIAKLTSGDKDIVKSMFDQYMDVSGEEKMTQEQIDTYQDNIDKANKLADAWKGTKKTIETVKKEIQAVVSDNEEEIKAISERVDSVTEMTKSWNDFETSLKTDLGLITDAHTTAKDEEYEIVQKRIENLKSFSEQATKYLSTIQSALSSAETAKDKLESINAEVNKGGKGGNKVPKVETAGQSHSGMELGYIGENSAKSKDAFRYIALSELKPEEVPRLLLKNEAVLTKMQQSNVLKNMQTAFVSGLRMTPPVFNTTSQKQPNSIIFNGDIVVQGVQNPGDLAIKIKSEFLTRLDQQLFK